MTDLMLAIAHHVLVFALMAVLAAEWGLVRRGMDSKAVRTVVAIDSSYGLLATLIIVVGVLRVIYGARGPQAFLPNPWFWAKMAVFVVIGLLSLPPTLRFLRWRGALKADPAFRPADQEVGRIKGFINLEIALFVLIPVFAATMVRSYVFR